MADVLSFGNLQLDIFCRTIAELPPPGGLRTIDAVYKEDTSFEGGLSAIRDFAKAGKANRTAVKGRQAPTPLPSPKAYSEPE